MKDASAIKTRDHISFFEFISKFIPFMTRIPYIAYHAYKGFGMITGDKKISWGKVLEDTAARHPDHLAIKSSEGNLTYRELNEAANRFASFLKSKNVKKGDTVTVCLTTRPELLVLFCGCSKIGAVCSMINVNQRGASLAHSFNLNKGQVIVVGEECYDDFQHVVYEVDTEGSCLCFIKDPLINRLEDEKDITEQLKQLPAGNHPETATLVPADRLAYIYTSGTSGGLPKAAVITNSRALSGMFWWGRIVTPIKPTHTVYLPLPFFHTNAITVGWPAAIYSGAAVAIRRKFSASGFLDDVRQFKATHFIYIGEVCRYLMAQPDVPGQDRTSLKYVIGNGLRADIWQAFRKRYGLKKIFEFYGAAEGVGVLTNILDFDYSVGMSLTPYAIVKYDVENDHLLRDEKGFLIRAEQGEPGLLVMAISQKTPFAGYSDKRKSEEKIIRDAFTQGDMWFNSGDMLKDLGFRQLQFVDRLGDTFRWKGENVSTMEVEKILLSLPAVSAAAVFGVKMPAGDGKAGMAAIVKEEGMDIDMSKLASVLNAALPKYAVPVFVRIVPALDWTPTHKVKKVNLKNEAYDLEKVQRDLFVMLPGTNGYVPVTYEIHADILAGKYRF